MRSTITVLFASAIFCVLGFAAGCTCGDDDDNSGDDDDADDDVVDDDTASDDDLDDDTTDDDTSDNDTADDDTGDDDAVDDDTTDDDSLDDLNIERVAGGCPGCARPGIAVRPDGSVVVLASRGRELVAYESFGASFQTNIILRDAGYEPKVVTDPDGALHIAWYHVHERRIFYSTNAGGSWVTTSIDDLPERSLDWNFDIARGADGTIHIAFLTTDPHTGTSRLYDAKLFDRAWTVEMVRTYAAERLWALDIAVGPQGDVAIAAVDGFDGQPQNVSVYRRIGAIWARDVAISNFSIDQGRVAVAIGSNGVTHILTSIYDAPLFGVVHVYESGGSWIVDGFVVGDYSVPVAFWLDTLDRPSIVFTTWNQLGLAVWDGADWQFTTRAVPTRVWNAAPGPDGGVHVAFADELDALHHARWDGADWDETMLDDAGQVWQDTSIALDSHGYAYIFFRERNPMRPGVANNRAGGWITEIFDSGDFPYDVPLGESIAADADDRIHLLYHDPVPYPQALRYAVLDETGWTGETVTPYEPWNAWLDLAIDANGDPHACVNDNGAIAMYHLSKTGGAWNAESVDTLGRERWECRIALDAQDSVHMTYGFDASPPTWFYTLPLLFYVNHEAVDWNYEWIGAGWYGMPHDFALDAQGFAHIVMQNRLGAGYAANASGAWRYEPILEGTIVALAMTVDEAGTTHAAIASANIGGDDVRRRIDYANNATGAWRLWLVDGDGPSPDPGAGLDIALDGDDRVHLSYTGQNTAYHAVFEAP